MSISRHLRIVPMWLALLAMGLLALPARGQQPSALSPPRSDAEKLGFDLQKLAAIDRLLQSEVDQRRIAGGAVLVARQGRIAHLALAGHQDAEKRLPLNADTIYRIASMTKPVTSVAVMMLADEGKLALDDPVAKFLPEFKEMRVVVPDAQPGQPLEQITTAAKSPITIRQLLNHTSGITYTFWNRPIVGDLYRKAGISDGLTATSADNVRKLASVPLVFQPGSGWEYGLNTDVLGRVVEVVSGQGLDEFFQERIFRPLGMRDTYFILPAEKRGRLAALYAPDESKQIRRVGDGVQDVMGLRYSATYPLEESNPYRSGGAGLVSTIGDYARFCQMLLNGGEFEGRRLLKRETVARMTRNQIGDLAPSFLIHGDKFGYGFGVVTESGKQPDEVASVGSYSWGGIFYTYFLVDPSKQLVVLCMTQVFPFDHLTLHTDVKQAVYAALNSPK